MNARANVCLAAAVVLVWAFSLSRSIFDPIGCDQAMYQYMAQRTMGGDHLYVDVWDQNAPGIIAIHWLSTRLVGGSPLSLRIFDAAWQGLTLAALVGLAARDGRRWRAGWLAAGLYVLSYYSMGYVQTAQREGFAVLPLLLAVHLVAGTECHQHGRPSWFVRRLLAGALGLFVFAIKPPLGLGFGALWLYELGRSRPDGFREGLPSVRGVAGLAGLTLGFIAAAFAAVGLLMHLGCWDACWGVLSRREMPGYIQGPALIRSILPAIIGGGVVLVLLAWATRLRGEVGSGREAGRAWAVAFAVFALGLMCRNWPGWRQLTFCFAGLWIPAAGSLLVCAWRGRSEIWRLSLLMLLAAMGAVIIQGQFFMYHLPPMLAMASYLAAVEIDHRLAWNRTAERAGRVWLAICMGCISWLVVGQWWPTMALATWRPYVLAGTSLAGHYTTITKHKLSCPTYATTIEVSRRIRELTADDEPIACIFHEPRIYYFAQRPAAYKLLPVQSVYRHMFADYMQAIRDRRPKVVVARVPEALRRSGDLQTIQAAVFDEAESFFGPPGNAIRELYHATEIIDDACLLGLNPKANLIGN